MIVYRIKGLKETIGKLDPSLIAQPARDFFTKIGITIQGRARENAPVDTGRLRASITYEVDSRQVPQYVRTGTNVFYGPYMEFGTGKFAVGGGGKRHWPPGEALGVWAQRHGFASGFQVARIIGMRGGLKPRKYLTSAAEDSVGDAESFLKEMEDNIAKAWDK